MKTNFRRLQLLLRFVFDANDFYSIDCTKYGISLQGKYSRRIVYKCKSLKLNLYIEEHADVYKNEYLRIVLTD